MNALAFPPGFAWSSQQLDNFILGSSRFAGCGPQYFSQRVAAGIEKLSGRSELGKGFDDCLPRLVQLGAGYLPMAREDLPEPNIGLKGAHCIATKRVVRNLVHYIRGINEAGNRSIV